MEAAARALLIVVVVALLVNFAQGGPGRVKRWAARTITGKDLLAPVQGPPVPAPATPAPRQGPPAPRTPAKAATPTHYIMA